MRHAALDQFYCTVLKHAFDCQFADVLDNKQEDVEVHGWCQIAWQRGTETNGGNNQPTQWRKQDVKEDDEFNTKLDL